MGEGNGVENGVLRCLISDMIGTASDDAGFDASLPGTLDAYAGSLFVACGSTGRR